MKKIILLLVLSILFVHYSCENDLDDIIEESENHSHSKNPIKKKEIISYKTFLEINKETKLSKEFDNIFFKKSNNTINIDTTEIVSITTDYQVTYTFKVNEDSLTNGFRNIIIQSTPNNNKFFLVEYPPNFNQSTNNEGLQVKVKQISENNINVKHSESLCIAIFECSEGMHTASNQEEWHECVATKKPAYALVPCGGVSTGGPSGEDPRGGMNEGIPTDPLDGQGNNSNYSSANVLAQYINLSTIEINWLIENPNISNKFLQLLSANGYSNQSKDFIKWAIDYLNVNYQAKNYFNQNPQDLDVFHNLWIHNSNFSLVWLHSVLNDINEYPLNINFYNNQYNYREQMSQSEIEIFDSLSILNQFNYLKNAYFASEKAKDLYPNSLHNGKGDAFRHAYFNALNVISIGEYFAEALSTAHEQKIPEYSYQYKETEMDLFNNQTGRDYGKLVLLGNPNSVQVLIIGALNSGNLRYLKPLGGYCVTCANENSRLTPTNQ